MATFRPCRVCSRWFRPNSRVGNRQHVCGDPACQKEWHRRSCAKGRKVRRDDTRARKVARLVVKLPTAEQAAIDPLVAIDWKGVRKVVGLEVMVTVREILKVLPPGPRDEMASRPGVP
jgi:hypothetical protein